MTRLVRGSILGLALLMTPFLAASSCSQVRCRFSSDCPSKKICGKRGYCVDQCKTKDDCHQEQICIEGECRPMQQD
ncbi:MAG: hypothetical protein H6728_07865 [Myxococcales bacterium]|nr:hypothetical protein [Myxococcales bacterium]MCB9642976.1 hypothetical protein [Myxococcales bacterium]